MTELQAAIGQIQLQKLASLNTVRTSNALKYRNTLEGLDLQFQSDSNGHVNHCLTAVLPDYLAIHRDWFLEAVRAEGAMINCLYPIPLSRTQLFSNTSGQQPISNRIASSLFNLYTNPDVSNHFIEVCCESVQKVIKVMKGGLS
jgi:dTDP-4-amino-4,6-dideoxygalactose transaminase